MSELAYFHTIVALEDHALVVLGDDGVIRAWHIRPSQAAAIRLVLALPDESLKPAKPGRRWYWPWRRRR